MKKNTRPNWNHGAQWKGVYNNVVYKIIFRDGKFWGWSANGHETKDRYNRKPNEVFYPSEFSFVGGGRKSTKQDQINDLTEQLSEKDKTIAELSECCKNHEKNYSDLSSRRYSESEEHSRVLQAERTRAAKAEERAAQQALTIASQKSALDLAGKTISQLSQAAR